MGGSRTQIGPGLGLPREIAASRIDEIGATELRL